MQCPMCGSRSEVEETTAGWIMGNNPNRCKCHKCGHTGSSVDWEVLERYRADIDGLREQIRYANPPKDGGNCDG